jgi:hypothetical protein
MADPELEFHRFFNRENLTNEEFLKHPAKLDLDSIHPVFAGNLRQIKQLINENFARNAEKIESPIGPVTLHLDYIAKPMPPVTRFASAISFTNSGFFFVGLTYDLAELMNDICGTLSQSSLTSTFLGIEVDSPEKRITLFACLFLIQIQFVVDHELGHHAHGHSTMRGANFFSSEGALDALLGPEDNLDRQAREVEADGYAIHMMAKNLFQKGTTAELVERFKPTTVTVEEFLVRLLLLCVASYLFLKPERVFDEKKVRVPLHPFGLMRLNVVMTDLRGWAADFRPDVLRYLTQATLTQITEVIGSAQPNQETNLAWDEQRIFLESADGEAYKQALYAAREVLRGQMSSRAWKIGDL